MDFCIEEGFLGCHQCRGLHKKRMDFQDIYIEEEGLAEGYIEEEGFAGDLHKMMDFQDIYMKKRGL
jgi:hypothetical protein